MWDTFLKIHLSDIKFKNNNFLASRTCTSKQYFSFLFFVGFTVWMCCYDMLIFTMRIKPLCRVTAASHYHCDAVERETRCRTFEKWDTNRGLCKYQLMFAFVQAVPAGWGGFKHHPCFWFTQLYKFHTLGVTAAFGKAPLLLQLGS